MKPSTEGHTMMVNPAGPPARRHFEFRLTADPFWLSPLRALMTDLGLRSELDLDAAADLTMAVDEAASMLMAAAVAGELITGRVEIGTAEVQVSLTLPGRRSLSSHTFAWRVLRALTDRVEPTTDASGIVLVKRNIGLDD